MGADPQETEWGRPVIVHCFDRERAGQHRGVGFLTPVVNRLKMLIKYDGTELDAAIINAFFAAYIESPFDHELVEGARSADDSKLSAYQTERANYHKDRRTALGDVGMSLLFPGEKIGVSANRPSANYDGFSSAMLRHVAAGTGLVAQQISQNWSEINYSAFRAAMLEAWKTFHRRRYDFAVNFSAPVAAAFLEESMEVDDYPMPSGPVPHFLEARSEYCRARWMGPGKGYVDPVKEKQGAILGLQSGLSTLDIEGSEQGEDWRKLLTSEPLNRRTTESVICQCRYGPWNSRRSRRLARPMLAMKIRRGRNAIRASLPKTIQYTACHPTREAEVIMAALAERLGVSKIMRMDGTEVLAQPLAFSGDDDFGTRARTPDRV